jgi:hypothetical protein
MALAQRKKAFWRRAEKNGKSLLRLGALKGFSGASDIFSFQSLAPVSFGSFLHRRRKEQKSEPHQTDWRGPL